MMYVDDHLWDFDLATALQEISAQRREQALRYRHELGQRQCVLAYLLLKRALREEFGIADNPVFVYGEHGKPVLADYPDIHFSLSHCREAVTCAVSSRPVGIDVESVRPLKESLVRYTMSETEQQKIFGAENPAWLIAYHKVFPEETFTVAVAAPLNVTVLSFAACALLAEKVLVVSV